MEKLEIVFAILILLSSVGIAVWHSWLSRQVNRRPEPPRPSTKVTDLDDDSWSNPEYTIEE